MSLDDPQEWALNPPPPPTTPAVRVLRPYRD
jgi:hypothetical protein